MDESDDKSAATAPGDIEVSIANAPSNKHLDSTTSRKLNADSTGMVKVEYLSDSIIEKEGKYIRLLGGSQWILSSSTLVLVTSDIIIVFEEIELKNNDVANVATAYIDFV